MRLLVPKKMKFLHLLTWLLVLTSFMELSLGGSGFCGSKCRRRCAKAGVQDRCMKYCGICCQKCGCVPSGTYGNKHECPCYGNMKNSKGYSKCP